MDSFISWLLDSPTPSIRYLTLRHLLERSEDDADVQTERAVMRTEGTIPRILSKQTADGYWENDPRWYGPKYKGTHWSLMLLPELAADPDDPQIRHGVDYMLDITAHHYMLEDRFDKSVPSPAAYGFTCFWGNLLRYVGYFGAGDDPRVQPIIAYIARNLEQGGCACEKNEYLPCAWGVARSLYGLAALPDKSDVAQVVIDKMVDFLLDPLYRLAEGIYPAKNQPSPYWTRLNFPLFYQVDVLFTLRVLGELGALGQPGAQPALEWLESQRQPDGRWHGVNPMGARAWTVTKDRQDIHRWVSLHATMVLQQAERQRQMA